MTFLEWFNNRDLVLMIQHIVSLIGIFIILSGVLLAAYQYIVYFFRQRNLELDRINMIRLNLGRSLILGLEFIVAADLIATTNAPDYYTVGIVAIIVVIRTILNYSLNLEITGLTKTIKVQE